MDKVADTDGDGCYHTVQYQEHQESSEEAHPHIRVHRWHVGDAIPAIKYEEELRVESENQYEVDEYEPPASMLKEEVWAQQVEVGKIDHQRSLKQSPYNVK
jgi:hypothetical protein